MVDVSLIIIAVVVPVVLVVLNLMIMARYLDFQATAGHYTTKAFIILGMLMAECTVLLLPLDVGNASGYLGCGFWNNDCGGLNLVLVWQVAYCIIIALVCVVFPFMIFFYEADDEGLAAEDAARLANANTFIARLCDWRGCGRNLLSAFIYTAITVVIVVVVIVLMYTFLGISDIPYQLTAVSVSSPAWQPPSVPLVASCSTAQLQAGTCSGVVACGSSTGCSFVGLSLTIQVTLIIYIAALISFVGWFIFSIYVAIGFVALPINCINAFKFRPKPLSASELLKQRKALRDRASELLKMCSDMGSKFVAFNEEVHTKRERRKAGKVNATDMNRFRVLVDLLEADLEKFQMSDPQYYRKYFNPFVPYFKLVFGLISIILTVCWIIQIILFMLLKPPVYGFLNNYFFWFDTWFPLFGTISVAIFALYLLLCVAVGNAKFGTRFFLIKVHPLEPGKTLLNGLIFNVSLILLCTLPVTQFCTNAFATYARFSDATTIFGTQMMYLRFFRYFWAYNVFLFMILIITVLASIYFSVCPSDRDYLNRVMEEIKVKNKKALTNLGSAIDRQAGSVEMVDVKKALKGK